MDRVKPKKFWNTKRISIIGGSVLLAAFLIYQFIFADKRSKLNVEQDKLTISTVQKGKFDEFIVVTGVVQPLKTIQLDAIVGGYVTEKLIEGGNMVKQGDVLLRLENQNLKLSFLQSETEASRLVNDLQNTRQNLKVARFTLQKTLSDLDFQLDQAKDAHERNVKLYKDKVIPEADYLKTKRDYEKLVRQREIEIESQKYQEENAKMQITQLEGTLASTQKNVSLWRQTLDNLVVKAPVSGLLSSMNIEVGSNISQGQNIGQIDDLNGFKMRVSVDEHYLSRIFVGLTGSMEFNGKDYGLKIIKIYPEILSGRFEVDMKFDNGAPEMVKRGQSAPIRLQLGQPSQATLLPVGGFFSETGGNWVYVVADGGKRAAKRKITLGRKNPEYFEVLEGLQPGEKVITSSYENFGDNEVLEF
ncbi:HlyD family secretion protein [Dyadobacter sp. BE34]|uniref:HlyD family secretion protein n=1 Tax=Dyadobacter fermentans TaxID=94254 RepID=A0ABU1QRR0_9BACT|nr:MULTISPECIES: efflux RND transporter periplasmic adaptor subunit [Dyadobacter]MDR6803823.1 HlyD family secretion protein [Dyadobacter fermentans]MDR7041563.1 HlyD family secretion protein [Dyadobacter sp. BE242]MDR7195966.1 HlyD family secretion protein [Dyadobacter sp. BE34]MDR7213489.1 HlyD family secretion protein [Dyadobacter sp. BE31]MDR7261372.1 HlyD family secretion protein [Dyadobacter sp. BE32]